MPPITNPVVEAYDFRATHQLVSTIATGTAPLAITSTTLVANLNADLLDGQHGTYYNDAANLTGTVAGARLSGAYTSVTQVGTLTTLTIAHGTEADLNFNKTGSNASSTYFYNAGSAFGSGFWDATNSRGVWKYELPSGDLVFNRPSRFDSIITATGGLLVNGGSFAAGRIYKDASYGTVIVSQTGGGGGNDFALLSPAGNLIAFVPTGTFNMSFAASVDVASTIKIGGTQVLTSRRTGWTAATGTATRSTFATSTVTLSVLAEHVKALIDDFITHGAIGA